VVEELPLFVVVVVVEGAVVVVVFLTGLVVVVAGKVVGPEDGERLIFTGLV
jgi:hypothetical protein